LHLICSAAGHYLRVFSLAASTGTSKAINNDDTKG
jgi:hypothetical protein